MTPLSRGSEVERAYHEDCELRWRGGGEEEAHLWTVTLPFKETLPFEGSQRGFLSSNVASS